MVADTANTGFEDDTEEEPEETPEPSRRGRYILLMGLVLLLSGGGAGAVYFSNNPGLLGFSNSGVDVALEEEAAPTSESIFLELKEIVADLKVPRGSRAFIRIRITLDIGSKEERDWINSIKPRILDAAQVFLRQKSYDELAGKEATEKTRSELLEVVNEAVKPARVNGLLFREFLVRRG